MPFTKTIMSTKKKKTKGILVSISRNSFPYPHNKTRRRVVNERICLYLNDPLIEGLLTLGAATILSLIASLPVRLISLDLKSPPSVTRLWLVFFITGIVRGLRTLCLKSYSFSLFTILRAWDAVNMVFSVGELPRLVAVGLRRR